MIFGGSVWPELLLLVNSEWDSVFPWPRSRGDVESAAQPPIKASPIRLVTIKRLNLIFIVPPLRHRRDVLLAGLGTELRIDILRR